MAFMADRRMPAVGTMLVGTGHFGMLLPDTEYGAKVQAEILSLLK
jgi:hypothetical protein